MSYFIYEEDSAFLVKKDRLQDDQPLEEYRTFTEAKREAIKMQQSEIDRLRKNLKLLQILRKFDLSE